MSGNEDGREQEEAEAEAEHAGCEAVARKVAQSEEAAMQHFDAGERVSGTEVSQDPIHTIGMVLAIPNSEVEDWGVGTEVARRS